MKTLTTRQQAIYDFIAGHIAEHDLPPSQSELAAAFAIPLRAAQKHLAALQAKGMLELRANTARGIRLLGGRRAAALDAVPGLSMGLLELPILGRVAAGRPIDPHADHQGSRLLDPRLFAPRPDYLLRVVGDSMRDDGILDGDLIAVARRVDAENGQTVVARLDGELTVKRLRRDRHGIQLLPRHPDFAPIVVTEQHEFALEGLFCGLVRPS